MSHFIKVGNGEWQACNIWLLQCLMWFNHWSGDVTVCTDGSLNCHILSGHLSYYFHCDKFQSCPLKMVNDTDLWNIDWNWAHSNVLVLYFSLKLRSGWLCCMVLHGVAWCCMVLSAENASFLVQFIAFFWAFLCSNKNNYKIWGFDIIRCKTRVINRGVVCCVHVSVAKVSWTCEQTVC